MLTQPKKVINSRSLYRLETDVPVILTPLFSDHASAKQYKTRMIDLSGSGCKVKLADMEMPETEKAIAEFSLDKEKYKLYCNVVRRNANKKIVALSFAAPYEAPEGETDPLVWLEEKIIQYVFEQQRKSSALPHFYRRR